MRHGRWMVEAVVAVAGVAAAVLFVVSALTPSKPAPATAVTVGQTPHADAAAGVDVAIDRLVAGLPPGSVSIAAQNLATSRNYRHEGGTRVRTASVIKLDILETLLLRRQDSGEALSDAETAQATAMIENSDNDAATDLWNDVGGAAGLRSAGARLGAPNTSPDADGYWGLSTTDADDQLNLLRDLVGPGPLTPASQGFALGLLRQVEADQVWGVSAIADPGSGPALKNGWLPIDDDNGLWAIGSVGIVQLHGQRVLVAVLTEHDDSQQDGENLTESLVRALAPALTAPAN